MDALRVCCIVCFGFVCLATDVVISVIVLIVLLFTCRGVRFWYLFVFGFRYGGWLIAIVAVVVF